MLSRNHPPIDATKNLFSTFNRTKGNEDISQFCCFVVYLNSAQIDLQLNVSPIYFRAETSSGSNACKFRETRRGRVLLNRQKLGQRVRHRPYTNLERVFIMVMSQTQICAEKTGSTPRVHRFTCKTSRLGWNHVRPKCGLTQLRMGTGLHHITYGVVTVFQAS